MKKVFLIGGGGHCRACIDVIESEGKFEIAGIFDLEENLGKKILNYQIIGTDNDIEKFVKNDHYFLITIGQIKNPHPRNEKFKYLKSASAQLATVISPRAYVSRYSQIGEGSIVMHDALINANVHVGNNCIINSKSLIEHDAVIEDGCHISTGAIVNGGGLVKNLSFVGSQSVLEEGAVVPENGIVSAGFFYRRSR